MRQAGVKAFPAELPSENGAKKGSSLLNAPQDSCLLLALLKNNTQAVKQKNTLTVSDFYILIALRGL